MSTGNIEQLIEQLRHGQLSRRGFVRRATALGVSAAAAGMLARGASAQGSTPAATGGGTKSITREDVEAQIQEAFEFEEVGSPGGEVIYVETTDIATVNPTLVEDLYSSYISGFMFDSLIDGNPVDGTDAPGLADYWEIGDDGVTYTFYLNKDAAWHDGTPLTSADVEFSFQSVLDETSLSVRRATVAATLKELKVVDEHTVQLIAIEPSATFVSDAAGQFGILPKHIWEGVEFANFGNDPGSTGQDPARVVGSGQFKFVEWVPGDHVTLERFDNAWNKTVVPSIDRFIMRIIPDPNAAIQSLVTGESDVTSIPFTQAGPLRQSNPELQITDFDTLSFNYYHCNQDESKETLFLDPAVRQAMLYALDRKLIAETVYQGFAIQADGTQPVLSVAYSPERTNTVYNFDADQARSLLESAGWVDSDGDGVREKDGVKFSFEAIYSEGVATYAQQIPYMQQAWREVGIEMIPTAVPFTSLLDQTDQGSYQMAVQGFNWSVDGSQIPMFGCDYFPPAGFNSMRYCNPAYDELENKARVELDAAARIDLLIEASNIVNDEAVIGINVFRKEIIGAAARMHNYFPNGYGRFWSVPRVWVDAS